MIFIPQKLHTRLTDSILTTPLVALKKRGFNVDRLLNQQREQRLRAQAEDDRETQSRNPPSVPDYDSDAKALTTAPASSSGSGPGGMTKRPESIGSGSNTGSSIMDQVAKKNPFMPGGFKGKLPSFMENMPGAFNSKKASSSATRGVQSGDRPPQQSTKQARHPFCAVHKLTF